MPSLTLRALRVLDQPCFSNWSTSAWTIWRAGLFSSALSQLKAANEQLGQTLAGLPESDTLAQHSDRLQQFKDQVGKAQAAATQLGTKLNCSTPS